MHARCRRRLARCRGGMGVLQHEAALQRGACAAAAAHAGGAWRAAPSLAITPAQARYRAGCRDDGIAWLATEIESGNVEYKYSLAACTTNLNRRHQLVRAAGDCCSCVFLFVAGCRHTGASTSMRRRTCQAAHDMQSLRRASILMRVIAL